jgi:hypothetical protein
VLLCDTSVDVSKPDSALLRRQYAAAVDWRQRLLLSRVAYEWTPQFDDAYAQAEGAVRDAYRQLLIVEGRVPEPRTTFLGDLGEKVRKLFQ